jgi:hypothetical protein
VNTTVENWDPHWECFVDNISIGALDLGEGVSNNRVLCEKTELNDGPHEFTINITSTSGVGTFWLDYIHYAPSATVSEETAYILVDNGDPAINYGSGWGALGSTANMTTVNGSEWTFDFTGMSYVRIFSARIKYRRISGRGLSWFSFIPTELSHNGSLATYSVDGGSPVTFILAGLSDPQGTGPTQYNQVFFTTPELSAGPHTLLVVNRGNNQQTPLTLDYLVIRNSSSPVDLSSSPAATATLSDPVNPGSSGSSGPPIVVIVGGVVGGIAFVVLCLLCIFFWRQRQRQRRSADVLSLEYDSAITITPFRDEALSFGNGSQIFEAGTAGRSANMPVRKQKTLVIPSTRSASEVIHEDSGVRFLHDDEVVHLPPGYSAQ